MSVLRAIATVLRREGGATSMEVLVLVGLAAGSLALVGATFGVALDDAFAGWVPV